jgi:23S rRNA (pseudouridine1915-N3)-methyltransferase
MKFSILSIGKGKNTLEQGIALKYFSRIPSGSVELVELESLATLELDAQMFEKNINERDLVIVLDETGDQVSTLELFRYIEYHEVNTFKKRCVFIIGGSDGIHESVKKKSDKIIAMGRMTWPHMLVRAMLSEQIYRMLQIKAGHPYHRGDAGRPN